MKHALFLLILVLPGLCVAAPAVREAPGGGSEELPARLVQVLREEGGHAVVALPEGQTSEFLAPFLISGSSVVRGNWVQPPEPEAGTGREGWVQVSPPLESGAELPLALVAPGVPAGARPVSWSTAAPVSPGFKTPYFSRPALLPRSPTDHGVRWTGGGDLLHAVTGIKPRSLVRIESCSQRVAGQLVLVACPGVGEFLYLWRESARHGQDPLLLAYSLGSRLSPSARFVAIEVAGATFVAIRLRVGEAEYGALLHGPAIVSRYP